jgi:hypothetical protein
LIQDDTWKKGKRLQIKGETVRFPIWSEFSYYIQKGDNCRSLHAMIRRTLLSKQKKKKKNAEEVLTAYF